MKTKTTKTAAKKKTRKKRVAGKAENPRESLNIKRMLVRSAISQGFRLVELGALAITGALLGVKISF